MFFKRIFFTKLLVIKDLLIKKIKKKILVKVFELRPELK